MPRRDKILALFSVLAVSAVLIGGGVWFWMASMRAVEHKVERTNAEMNRSTGTKDWRAATERWQDGFNEKCRVTNKYEESTGLFTHNNVVQVECGVTPKCKASLEGSVGFCDDGELVVSDPMVFSKLLVDHSYQFSFKDGQVAAT